MNTTLMKMTNISDKNFKVIAPMAMSFALIAIVISSVILILILLTKKLHTITHLLICNTCVSTIFYCIVQCNNYIYLLFITWDTSDMSCRWRAYFAYMTISAFSYSYLLQAISRLFFSLLSTRYRWLISFKTHVVLILIKWMIVLVLPLPAIITKDIYFRPGLLCWVPMKSFLHVTYTFLAYDLIPIVLVITIYITIYVKIRRSENNACKQQKPSRRQNRDFEVLRNIMILFGIYILCGFPSLLFFFTRIHLL